MQSPESTNERPAVRRPARTSLGNRRVAMRVVRHPEQGMVLVYELDPAPGSRSSLIFESGTSCTRLFHYPSDWRRMPDADLIALPLAAV